MNGAWGTHTVLRRSSGVGCKDTEVHILNPGGLRTWNSVKAYTRTGGFRGPRSAVCAQIHHMKVVRTCPFIQPHTGQLKSGTTVH